VGDFFPEIFAWPLVRCTKPGYGGDWPVAAVALVAVFSGDAFARRRMAPAYSSPIWLIELLGVPEKQASQAIAVLDRDRRSGFREKQKLWGGRRYWPAVRAYFDLKYTPLTLRSGKPAPPRA
jgi:hypothetical protein